MWLGTCRSVHCRVSSCPRPMIRSQLCHQAAAMLQWGLAAQLPVLHCAAPLSTAQPPCWHSLVVSAGAGIATQHSPLFRKLHSAPALLQLVTSDRAQWSVTAYELDLTVRVLQIGRAGRDGLPSKCKLMWRAQDWLKNNMIQVTVDDELVRAQAAKCKAVWQGAAKIVVWGSSCNLAQHCSGPGSQAAIKQSIALGKFWTWGSSCNVTKCCSRGAAKSSDLAMPLEAGHCTCAVLQHANGLTTLPALDLCVSGHAPDG